MTRVSRHKLHKNKLEELNKHFLYLITTMHSLKEIENFLEGFLTPEEKIMLAKRLVLLMMIQKGYPSSVVQSTLNISYETIRQYTNQLALKTDPFKKTIERLVKRQKNKEFWQKIDKILTPLDIAIRSKNDMKARAKLMSGDWS